jgi:hypothetical protein
MRRRELSSPRAKIYFPVNLFLLISKDRGTGIPTAEVDTPRFYLMTNKNNN